MVLPSAPLQRPFWGGARLQTHTNPATKGTIGDSPGYQTPSWHSMDALFRSNRPSKFTETFWQHAPLSSPRAPLPARGASTEPHKSPRKCHCGRLIGVLGPQIAAYRCAFLIERFIHVNGNFLARCSPQRPSSAPSGVGRAA